MCRDSRIVPGAAATEIELAQRLKEYANAEIGYFLLLIFSDDIILGNFLNIIHVRLPFYAKLSMVWRLNIGFTFEFSDWTNMPSPNTLRVLSLYPKPLQIMLASMRWKS